MPDNHGNYFIATPLSMAIAGKHYNIVQLLIQRPDCMVNHEKNEANPLCVAIEHNDATMVKLLLKFNANVNQIIKVKVCILTVYAYLIYMYSIMYFIFV